MNEDIKKCESLYSKADKMANQLNNVLMKNEITFVFFSWCSGDGLILINVDTNGEELELTKIVLGMNKKKDIIQFLKDVQKHNKG